MQSPYQPPKSATLSNNNKADTHKEIDPLKLGKRRLIIIGCLLTAPLLLLIWILTRI